MATSWETVDEINGVGRHERRLQAIVPSCLGSLLLLLLLQLLLRVMVTIVLPPTFGEKKLKTGKCR